MGRRPSGQMGTQRSHKKKSMPFRKYLCAAPHRDVWEERARALLKSLSGERKKRQQILRQTLSALSLIIEEKKRTGPGRKSNAEHAINFYRYVLGLDEEEDDDEELSESDEAPEVNVAEKPAPSKGGGASSNIGAKQEPRRRLGDGRSSKRARTGDHDAGEEKEEEPEVEGNSMSVASMDSQEFLDQHNDLCEVCNVGGEVLCCSTCNLVFHLSCSRPVLKSLPPDNWSCSYCVASGVTGYKREARVRRKAAAAVRQMARLRADLLEKQKAGGHEEPETNNQPEGGDKTIETAKTQHTALGGTEAKGSNGVPPPEASKEAALPEEKRPKKKLDLRKIEETFSPSMSLEGTNERRARRSRRQPTLYDPQDCPASEWQSDGAFEWKTLNPDGEPIPVPVADPPGAEGEANAATSEEPDKNEGLSQTNNVCVPVEKKEEPIWCNFCKDDPAIPVCCFCACRVCFGKHDGSKLLLCDHCDEEYHTYCLNPPLQSVPTSRKWFCPTCRNMLKKDRAEMGQSLTTRAKADSSKRSSPAGSTRLSSLRSPKTTTGQQTGGNDNPPVGGSLGKTRASSERKSSHQQASSTTPSSSSKDHSASAPPVVKRGVGRPRTRPHPLSSGKSPGASSGTSATTHPTPRPRGRPPKTPRTTTPSTGGFGTSERPMKRSHDGRVPAFTTLDRKRSSKDRTQQESKSKSTDQKDSRSRRETEAAHSSKKQLFESSRLSLESSEGRALPSSSSSQRGQKRTFDGKEPVLQPSPPKDPFGLGPHGIQRSRSGRMVKRNSFHDELLDRALVASSKEAKKSRVSSESVRRDSGPKLETDSSEAQLLPEDTIPKTAVDKGVFRASQNVPKGELGTFPPEGPSMASSLAVGKDAKRYPQPNRTEVTPKEENLVDAPKRRGSNDESKKAAGAEAPRNKTGDDVIDPLVVSTAGPRSFAPPTVSTVGTLGPATGLSSDSMSVKVPRRKPGARECMQISRRFGASVIPQRYMDVLLDYCTRGKVEHLIRMRERLDDHSRFLEAQLAGLEAIVKEKGEIDIVVPPATGNRTAVTMIMMDDHHQQNGAGSPLVSSSVSDHAPQPNDPVEAPLKEGEEMVPQPVYY